MVAIVISEKGGAERKERFDKPEITIGRVKGNDVLLAKGNVSKRHARLIQRDGRFIVTDLKSTNGTYVNHRRITHAVVREGDRIYIGDFVLWLEGPPDAGPIASAVPTADLGLGEPPFEAEVDGEPVSVAEYAPPGVAPSGDGKKSGPPDGVVSHFPIEQDPDDSGPVYDVPSPPRTPSGLRPGQTGSLPAALEITGLSDSASSSPISPVATPPASHPEADGAPGHPSLGTDPRIDRQQLGLAQVLLDRLVAAVESQLDRHEGLDGSHALGPEQVAHVQATVERQLGELLRAGPLPVAVDEEALRAAALRELLELGPIGALLADEATSQVQVVLHRTTVTRRGRKWAHTGLDFTSDHAVARALNRLCGASGSIAAGEFYVSRQLPDGQQLFAVRPPASPRGHLLVLSKVQRSGVTLNGLVRSGTISRGMATLLEHCVTARTNLLVVGPAGSGTRRLVDALVAAIPQDDRTVWLCEPASVPFVPEHVAVLHLGTTPAEQLAAIEAASKLEPDHLVVPRLSGECLASLLDAVAQGCEGVVLHARASTLRQAIDRLGADVAGSRPGMPVETAREWLASAFDLGLEVARLRDRRQRVARLAEFRATAKGTGLRDVFTFAYHRTAEGGSIEGAFHATGAVPQLVEDLAARGLPLDTSIFRRHPSG
jgi:pilus assembly protein CpaF